MTGSGQGALVATGEELPASRPSVTDVVSPDATPELPATSISSMAQLLQVALATEYLALFFMPTPGTFAQRDAAILCAHP